MGLIDSATLGIGFTATLLGGLVGMVLAVWLGRRLGLVVKPRLFGKCESSITYLGGPALAITALSAYLIVGQPTPIIRILLLAGMALLVLGFVDDYLTARNGIHPMGRLAVEIVIAFLAWTQGLSAFETAPNWLDMIVTVVFLVGGINAFNLIDNMDGVAGLTALAVAFGVVMLGLAGNQPQYVLLAACVGGATIAFLCFNLYRPKVYLGDAGALFLGLVLSGMALTIDVGFQPPGNFFAAILLFAVPFTDTATRQLSRWVAGGSLFDISGGTDHISHRLVKWGFLPREAAYLHGIAGLFAASAVGISVTFLYMAPMYVILAAFATFGLAFVWYARNRSGKDRAPRVEGPLTEGHPSRHEDSELGSVREDIGFAGHHGR